MSIRETLLPLAQLNANWRSGRWRGLRLLCYHSVVDEPTLTLLSKRTLVISEEGFRRNLETIRTSGYQVLSMAHALELLESGGSAYGQYICITFDDGRLDNFTTAWPILRNYDYSAHFFVNSAFVGTHAQGAQDSYVDRFMAADQMRAMMSEGASFGSHGQTHRDLTTLDAESIRRELSESRRELEEMLGTPVVTHAYPYALYDKRVLQEIRDVGYSYGFKVNTGVATFAGGANRYTLVRNAMRSGRDNPENYALIRGGYDFSSAYSEAKMRFKYKL